MKTEINDILKPIKKTALAVMLCLLSFISKAQVDSLPGDPGVIKAYTIQNMHFGSFSAGNAGGTLTILPTGTRSSTGTVLPLNIGTTAVPAIFDIDAVMGAMVSISNGPDITLTGSNGGSMSMHIGASNPTSPFITTVQQPLRTRVRIGATLTVGSQAANPPGTYSGTFYVTFNLE